LRLGLLVLLLLVEVEERALGIVVLLDQRLVLFGRRLGLVGLGRPVLVGRVGFGLGVVGPGRRERDEQGGRPGPAPRARHWSVLLGGRATEGRLLRGRARGKENQAGSAGGSATPLFP